MKHVVSSLAILVLAAAFTLPASIAYGQQKSNPCNPGAAKAANPCAPKAANPCAPKAANPCAPKAANPENPCAAKKK
jgi:hypothetical protein